MDRFLRHELKIVLDKEETERVRTWAVEHLQPDPNATGEDGSYRIESLYLDNAKLDVFHRALPDAGTKYRIRRYGDESLVYLERKRRRRSVVTKRRCAWPMAQINDVYDPEKDVVGYAEDFKDRVHTSELAPKLLVCYTRHAWLGEKENSRLTLDSEIRAYEGAGISRFTPEGDPIAITEDTVLELKYDDLMPESFAEVLRLLGRDVGAFSKYGRGITASGLASNNCSEALNA